MNYNLCMLAFCLVMHCFLDVCKIWDQHAFYVFFFCSSRLYIFDQKYSNIVKSSTIGFLF